MPRREKPGIDVRRFSIPPLRQRERGANAQTCPHFPALLLSLKGDRQGGYAEVRNGKFGDCNVCGLELILLLKQVFTVTYLLLPSHIVRMFFHSQAREDCMYRMVRMVAGLVVCMASAATAQTASERERTLVLGVLLAAVVFCRSLER